MTPLMKHHLKPILNVRYDWIHVFNNNDVKDHVAEKHTTLKTTSLFFICQCLSQRRVTIQDIFNYLLNLPFPPYLTYTA